MQDKMHEFLDLRKVGKTTPNLVVSIGDVPERLKSSKGILCEQGKNRNAPLLSKTPHEQDAHLQNEKGNCQHLLKVSFLKHLKNEIHDWQTSTNFGNKLPPPLICLNHFVLIEVRSIDILVACLRISTGLNSFRETHPWEHLIGQIKSLLIMCLKHANISDAFLIQTWFFFRRS